MKKLTAILLTGAIAASLSACSTQAEEPASLGMDLSQYTVVDISHLQEADMPADPSLQLPQSDFFGRIGVDGGLHNWRSSAIASTLAPTWMLPIMSSRLAVGSTPWTPSF